MPGSNIAIIDKATTSAADHEHQRDREGTCSGTKLIVEQEFLVYEDEFLLDDQLWPLGEPLVVPAGLSRDVAPSSGGLGPGRAHRVFIGSERAGVRDGG